MRSFCSIACSLASGQLLVQRIRWVGAGTARKSSTSTDSSDAQQTVVVNSLIGAIGWGVTGYDWLSFSTSFHVAAAYLAVAAPVHGSSWGSMQRPSDGHSGTAAPVCRNHEHALENAPPSRAHPCQARGRAGRDQSRWGYRHRCHRFSSKGKEWCEHRIPHCTG